MIPALNRVVPQSVFPIVAVLVCAVAVPFSCAAQSAPAEERLIPSPDNTLLLEPESFQALGGWIKEGKHITAGNTGGTAFAGFTITAPGLYHVWARSMDQPDNQPGTRRFRLRIDDEAAAKECGLHGRQGWSWEQVAARRLEAGVHAISVEDSARFFGRLEAILVTRTDMDPNAVERDALKGYAQAPVQATPVSVVSSGPRLVETEVGEAGVAAELRNADMVVRLRRGRLDSGRAVLVREVEFLSGEREGSVWRAELEPIYLLRSKVSSVRFSAFSPTWESSEREEWRLAGRVYRLPADSRDAFRAGDRRVRMIPVSVHSAVEGGLEVTYEPESDGASGVTARWSLPDRGFAMRMEASARVAEDGFYSLGYAAGGAGGLKPDQVAATQLPPLYQFKRVPEVPLMLTSSTTPHPLALVEQASPQSLTLGVVADADGLSVEWAKKNNARYGFTLRGPENGIQPAVFSPILGGRDSHVAAGGALKAAWWTLAAPESWADAMREVDGSVLGLRDYREPWTCSLTWQALNIIDLIKSGRGFRWYDRLKGPMNIESADTATQSAPLMMMSAALLTGDEEFFARRSLPSLEFMLSRSTAHYALSIEGNYYVKREEDTRLTFENRYFGSALWQGMDDLTEGLNPWLRYYLTRNGKVRAVPGGPAPTWSERLALYRSAPDPVLLRDIEREAEAWAERAFGRASSTSPGVMPFYNVSFYPYWWDLTDLYELTRSPALLDYARRGASLTVAGQWVHPIVRPGDMTLYPGGKLTETRHVWWDGAKGGRLGFPADKPETTATATFDLPEHAVPAWLPSTVGLSLEQPATYYNTPGQSGLHNIQLMVWAANLLRLSGETGDDYWRMYARNALIGRAASYPGYYMANFMDLQHDPDYPVNGPDLTAFYWHHAPVHLAMVVDYIVTDADVRTGGAVRFPYAKSQGYVWFSSRVYGGRPGRVFDDPSCRLMFDREKFGVDTPMVDYFGARGRNQFHLVLMNQARGPVAAKAVIKPEALGTAPGAVARVRAEGADGVGETLRAGADGGYELTLEKNGWAVLTFDATEHAVAPAGVPLETKPVVLPLEDTAWGALHAFRIRSPFGVDSLYVGLTGAPADGVITCVPEGDYPAIPKVEGAPYELSVGDIPMDRDFEFRLKLERSGAPVVETPVIRLPGTPRKAAAGENQP